MEALLKDLQTVSAANDNPRLIDNLAFGFLHRNSQVPAKETAAVAALMAKGPCEYRDLRDLLGGDIRLHRAKAFSLLAKRRVSFDLYARLESGSEIICPEPIREQDIRTINESLSR